MHRDDPIQVKAIPDMWLFVCEECPTSVVSKQYTGTRTVHKRTPTPHRHGGQAEPTTSPQQAVSQAPIFRISTPCRPSPLPYREVDVFKDG